MKKTFLLFLIASVCACTSYNPPTNSAMQKEPSTAIQKEPSAVFTIDEIDYTYIVIKDSSTGDKVVYDFGDGEMQEVEPNSKFGHLYNYSGTYSIICTAYLNGKEDIKYKSVTVSINP